jgi:elongator complex protein 3
VELGVQAIDDSIYKKVNRGHTVKDVIDATRRLKDADFKVFYHIMLGLPGSNPKKDIQMFKKLFSDERFKPDGLKIYPCQVIKGSGLEILYKKGKYKPYTKELLQELIIKLMTFIPNYCRVMRIMREIPPLYLVAGTTRIDLRKDVEAEIKKRKLKIKEIRFREIGFRYRDKLPKEKINQNLKLKITKYQASKGIEYFLEIINRNNILFALCRLRIRGLYGKQYGAIRELHVYGPSLPIGQKRNNIEVSQHKGLGKKLVKKAEEIAKKHGIKELEVIAGVGVREYFYKQGYKLKGYYVSKILK